MTGPTPPVFLLQATVHQLSPKSLGIMCQAASRWEKWGGLRRGGEVLPSTKNEMVRAPQDAVLAGPQKQSSAKKGPAC